MNRPLINILILFVFIMVAYVVVVAQWPLSISMKFDSSSGTAYFAGSYLVNSARSIRLTDAHGNVVFQDSETHKFPFTIVILNGLQVRMAELSIQYDRFVPCVMDTVVYNYR